MTWWLPKQIWTQQFEHEYSMFNKKYPKLLMFNKQNPIQHEHFSMPIRKVSPRLNPLTQIRKKTKLPENTDLKKMCAHSTAPLLGITGGGGMAKTSKSGRVHCAVTET